MERTAVNWELTVAWAIGVVMVVVAIIFGTGIWLASPVVVDGVVRVGILVTHLIVWLYLWFLVKESH